MAPPDWDEVTGVQRVPSAAERAAGVAPKPYAQGELEAAVDAMLDARSAPDLVFQPIVDLARGLAVGYEALSRFRGPPVSTPDKWFAAAARIGRGEELEALVIERALRQREQLPSDCYLAINVAPEALLSRPVQTLLRARPLARLVFELTEHTAAGDYDLLARAVAEVRELGAFVAVDDAGAGYASLQQILMLRPDFVKLDRSLIAGLHLDEAKVAVIEMFGGFTSRIDAWLLAEGIEDGDELARLAQLGVPLGQGYLLGRPAPAMGELDRTLASTVQGYGRGRPERRRLSALAEPYPTAPSSASDAELARLLNDAPTLTMVPLLDGTARPTAIAARAGAREIARRSSMCVLESSVLRDALKRALTRPLASRFDPLVCCDERGAYRGVVRVERLMEALLEPSR